MIDNTQYGLSGFKGDSFLKDDIKNLYSLISNLDQKFLPVRVIDVILDDQHKDFDEVGGWNSIGTVKYERLDLPEKSNATRLWAKPFYSNFKTFPLKNEIVLLVSLPNTNSLNNLDTEEIYYYLNTISLWNHPHHNAFPNILNHSTLSESQQKDYKSIEGGNVRRVNDNSTEIELSYSDNSGGKFIEKTNIHPILPFIGDNILEGRFGNSIRLGSTAKSKSIYANNWSSSGEEGDPISIIRNGQPLNSTNKGWEPTVENINKDLSSIYLTSTQQVPIDISSKNYTGIREDQIPTYPLSYKSNQIILNSGRLVLNSSVDSILLSSKKVIALSAIGDIGLSTRDNINLSGKEIHLGGTTASESLVMGDTFIKQFKVLLDGLNQLCDALITEPTLKSTPLVATGIKNIITTMNNQSDNFLSKISKTL